MTHERPGSRLLLFALIAFAVLALDQVSKQWATQSLVEGQTHSYFGDTFRVQFAKNPGAFLGLGGGMSETSRFWLLTALNAIFLAAIAGVLVVKWRMPASHFIAFTLLLSGGAGNLIDRATDNGLVTDFLNVGIGGLRTGIFNIADMAIMAGAGLLFVVSFRESAGAESTQNGDAPLAQAGS